MIGKITIALVAGVVALIVGVRTIAQRAPRPDRLGVTGGQLTPCPDKPNCASSYEDLNPFTYVGDRSEACEALAGILETWSRTTIIQKTNDYIHVEFRSSVFNFIDDGEFYLPAGETVVHYRSAARSGHYDLGVNASRIAEIGARLAESLK